MAELATRRTSLPTPRRVGLSGRPQRELIRRVNAAEADGVVAAARITAAAYATHTALTEVAMLTNMEAQLLKMCPLGEARYQAIVDTFAGVAAAELMRLAR